MPVGFSVLLIVVMVFAVTFDYINGFHDTANAIATSVATRVLSPGRAATLASIATGALTCGWVASCGPSAQGMGSRSTRSRGSLAPVALRPVTRDAPPLAGGRVCAWSCLTFGLR